MSIPKTCESLSNAISSPGSESGPTLFGAPAGLMIELYGPDLARANLSARQAKALGLLTSGTYGRTSSTSSASAALQSSMESKLQAATQILGSTLYAMTWKPWITPSGRSRFRLRASVLPTQENGRTGWPTPTCQANSHCYGPRKTIQLKTYGAARLCDPSDSWPIGTKANTEGWDVSWTPQRAAVSGVTLIGSEAGIAFGGQLNPDHSRWLQGIPAVWSDNMPTETRSTLKRRASSSKPL